MHGSYVKVDSKKWLNDSITRIWSMARYVREYFMRAKTFQSSLKVRGPLSRIRCVLISSLEKALLTDVIRNHKAKKLLKGWKRICLFEMSFTLIILKMKIEKMSYFPNL